MYHYLFLVSNYKYSIESNLTKTQKHFAVINDFIVHFNKSDNRKTKLIDLMKSYGFRFQIQEKTTVLNNLGNIFINFEGELEYHPSVIDANRSNHYTVNIYVNLSMPTLKPKKITYFDKG